MPGTPIRDLDLSLSLSEALDELRHAYHVAGRSPQTILTFDIHIRHLIDWLAEPEVRDRLGTVTSLDQVTTGHLTAFLSHEKERGLAPASLSVILRTTRRFFQYHVEQGHLDRNPARAVMAPSVVVEAKRFLDDAELERLLATIAKDKTLEGVRDTALVRVLMDTGLRRGEVMGLRATGDVDLDARVITVRAATSKMRRARTGAFSNQTAVALRRYLRVREAYLRRTGRQNEQALWISAKGALLPNGALQALRRRLEAAGLPQVSMHSLRHGWTARLVKAGVPMTYVMALGGWSSPTLPTARYGQYGVGGRAIDAMHEHLDR